MMLQDSLRNLGCDRLSEISSKLYQSPVADDWITGSDSCINKSVAFRAVEYAGIISVSSSRARFSAPRHRID